MTPEWKSSTETRTGDQLQRFPLHRRGHTTHPHRGVEKSRRRVDDPLRTNPPSTIRHRHLCTDKTPLLALRKEDPRADHPRRTTNMTDQLLCIDVGGTSRRTHIAVLDVWNYPRVWYLVCKHTNLRWFLTTDHEAVTNNPTKQLCVVCDHRTRHIEPELVRPR